MAYEDVTTVVASAARTTTGNSGALPAPKSLNMALSVEVSASSGTTPNLVASVEWSFDGGTNFCAVDTAADAFAAITTTVRVTKLLTVKAPHYRIVWTITGTTPSFTFSCNRYGVGS